MLIINAQYWFDRLFPREDGQGMVEYGLIIAGIAVVVAAIIFLLGKDITNFFNNIRNSLHA